MMRRRMARRAVRRRTGRPLLRAAAVGGAGYYAGKKITEGRQAEAMQDEQIAELQDQVDSQPAAAYAPPPAQPKYAPPAPPPAPAAAPPPAPAASSSTDRIAQLKELGELRDAGVLTEEEFQQEKQRILSGS